MAKAESRGGTRMIRPEKMAENVEIGLFNDPEGHLPGVVNVLSDRLPQGPRARGALSRRREGYASGAGPASAAFWGVWR